MINILVSISEYDIIMGLAWLRKPELETTRQPLNDNLAPLRPMGVFSDPLFCICSLSSCPQVCRQDEEVIVRPLPYQTYYFCNACYPWGLYRFAQEKVLACRACEEGSWSCIVYGTKNTSIQVTNPTKQQMKLCFVMVLHSRMSQMP